MKKKIEITHKLTCTHTHMYIHACALTSSVSFRKYFEFLLFVGVAVIVLNNNKKRRRRGESHTRNKRSDDTNQTMCVMHRWKLTKKDEKEGTKKREWKKNIKRKYVKINDVAEIKKEERRRRRRRGNQEEH